MEKKHNSNFIDIDNRIIDALIDIAQKKSFADISVIEVCKKANINRTTFYKHYHGVWDVVEKIKNNVRKVVNIVGSEYDYREFTKHPDAILFSNIEFHEKNKERLRKIANIKELAPFLSDIVHEVIVLTERNETIPEEFKNTLFAKVGLTFFMSGLFYVFGEWIKGYIDCPLSEAMKIVYLYARTLDSANEEMKTSKQNNF